MADVAGAQGNGAREEEMTGHKFVVACAAWVLAWQAALAGSPPPAKAYIQGVPFVGYHQVRDATFPGSNVVNPSLTAVSEMMYGYWGGDFLGAARTKTLPAGWISQSGERATLEELKALIARGVPVAVTPATTPYAHRLYLTPKLCASFKSVSYTEPRPTSGALGEMVSLRAVEEIRDGGCDVGLNDSVYLAARLLVGYDDERRVLLMHDPSLGPDLELAYDEFVPMWQAMGAKYWAVHPEPVPETPPGRAGNVRPRTPDDDAAAALFRAYGLETIGDHAQAEQLLRSALAPEGVSAARRHLLLLEMAVTLNETGRCAQAIDAARAANAEFEDYALAHTVLANLLSCSGDPAAKREATKEQSRAKSLCGTRAQRRVADELGRDFHVTGCKGELLGWYRP